MRTIKKLCLASSLSVAILAAIFSVASPSPAAAGSNASHVCVVTTTGTVKCWGYNSNGQLGDGTATSSPTPVDVIGLASGATRQVTTGTFATCVVTTAGGVKCWGFGSGGNGPSSGTPTDVPGLTGGIAAISANYYYSCALTTGGGVKCWGYNSNGQLGDGTTRETGATPVDVVGLSSGVTQISTGISHACGLTTSGGVKCWGGNGAGQLGNGTFGDSAVPVDVLATPGGAPLGGVAQISAGLAHTCARMTTGGVKCWGNNSYGNLGNVASNYANSPTPIDADGLPGDITQLSAGGHHNCALTASGGVMCWGGGGYGQLGDGNRSDSVTPVPVTGLASGVTQINASGYGACALKTGGGVKCWGFNGSGQAGDGTTTDAWVPVDVVGLASGIVVLPDIVKRTAYVTNSVDNTVTPIELATNKPGTPIGVGSLPFGVAITPDGKTAYVTGSSSVTPIDVATNLAGTPIPIGGSPVRIAITPDGATAYVVTNSTNSVTPIDVATNSAGIPIPVGSSPAVIAITPDGRTAYVTNRLDNSMTPIDVATNSAGGPILVGGSPLGIAITPDGTTAYVTNRTSNTVTPIDLATNIAGTAIPVGPAPVWIAITPDGKTAYVSNTDASTVTPITLATNSAGPAIIVGSGPQGIAITPDNKTAYVVNRFGNSVTPIDVATNHAGAPVRVGNSPFGIAIAPNPRAAQSVSFPPPASPATYHTSFSVAPTATSGLPVSVGASGACSISGGTVLMKSGTGLCRLTATQAGDANYRPATAVVQTVIAQPASSSVIVSCPVTAQTYTGSAITPCTVAVTGAGGLSLTPTPLYASNTDVGPATASYTFAGDADHAGSSGLGGFTIGKASSTVIVSCPVSVTYTGSAITPCAAAVTGAGGLSLTVAPSYANNTDKGTASASATYAGDPNHTGSTGSSSFGITPAVTVTGTGTPGVTTITVAVAPPALPSGFLLQGVVYDVTTTATLAPPFTVCFSGAFGPTDVLLHYEGSAWVDRTTSNSGTTLCGLLPSLSPVALVRSVSPSSPDGRMFGSGFVDVAGTHYHFAFRVLIQNQRSSGRFEYWVRTAGRGKDDDDEAGRNGDDERDYGRGHRKGGDRFEATAIAQVTFVDDPASTPGRGRKAPTVDTVLFTGTGKWNGVAGYTFEVRATDRDEPGRNRDTLYAVIKNAAGEVVNVNGALGGGNIESTRLRR